MHLSAKKLLLLGFVFVLLFAIPLTVYLVKQQQSTQSSAVAATTLSFFPQNPSIKKGQTADLDIFVDPSSTNAISFIKIVLSYDSTKLASVSGGVKINSWTVSDGTTFTPNLDQGVEYSPNTISFALNLGTSPQNLIQTKTKIATVSFTAVAETEQDVPTQVIFANQTQVLSAGANVVNVLSSSAPANIIVSSETPSATSTPTPTTAIIATLSPTVTGTPSSTPSASASDSATLDDLLCESLTVDPATVGTAPFSVNLTAVGSSSSSAITKVTFDFGDATGQDVTDAGGIGTDAVSVLVSHTYTSSGTFNAKATLTDENGNVSSNDCTATISVEGAPSTSTPTQAVPSPLPPTGPNGLITIGAIGAMLFFIGAILLLAL